METLLLNSRQNWGILLLGDQNAKNKAWNNKKNNEAGKILQKLIDNTNLTISYLRDSTYCPVSSKKSASIIDLVITNNNINISATPGSSKDQLGGTSRRSKRRFESRQSPPEPRDSEGRLSSSLGEQLIQVMKAQHSKLPPLPMFDGAEEYWEYFKDIFNQTTTDRQIPPHQNMERLKKALQGRARALVRAYLDRPSCVEIVMEALESTFSGATNTSDTILSRCKKESHLKSDLSNLNAFYLEVATLKPIIEKANSTAVGELAVSIIQKRLTRDMQQKWGLEKGRHPDTFQELTTFLKDYKSAVKAGGGELDMTQSSDRRSRSKDRSYQREQRDWRDFDRRYNRREAEDSKKRRADKDGCDRVNKIRRTLDHDNPPRPLHISTGSSHVDLCDMGCTEEHELGKCPKFASLNYMEASRTIREKRRCFSCLGKHLARLCPQRGKKAQ